MGVIWRRRNVFRWRRQAWDMCLSPPTISYLEVRVDTKHGIYGMYMRILCHRMNFWTLSVMWHCLKQQCEAAIISLSMFIQGQQFAIISDICLGTEKSITPVTDTWTFYTFQYLWVISGPPTIVTPFSGVHEPQITNQNSTDDLYLVLQLQSSTSKIVSYKGLHNCPHVNLMKWYNIRVLECQKLDSLLLLYSNNKEFHFVDILTYLGLNKIAANSQTTI